jgi:replicative DNA helicase
MADRLFSPEAEGCVIGGLLVSPVAISDVMATVRAADFAIEFNRRAFGAMVDLTKANQPIDLMTVAERMEATTGLTPEEFAGLAVLARDTPSAANVLAYAGLVRNHARRRRLLAASTAIADCAKTLPDVEQSMLKARALLDAIDADRPTDGPRELADLMPAVLQDLDDRAHRTKGLLGLSTDLPDVDRLLDGLCPGRLYVLAGRPGTGKSVFGLQALRAAIATGKRAALFTLEMPAAEVIHRLLASEIPLPLDRLQAARLTDGDWGDLLATSARLTPQPLYLDDSSQLSIADLQTRARRLHRRAPLDLIVVDYIGLMDGDRDARQNRTLEVGSISRGLKQLAKELSVPVLALAQLNRTLEQRGDKRPILSDLRESGSIEQDADVVAFIYRDDLHNPDSPDAGCAELLIRKNRAGRAGMIPLRFDGEHCRFQSLAGGLPSRNIRPAEPIAPRRRGWNPGETA